MPTLVQIKQRAIIKAHRRYVALGHAMKLAPKVKPMLLDGMSQHQIAAKLTELRLPTPNDHRSGKRVGTSQWSQMQVSRLLKNMGIIQEKMKWYYRHAHRELDQLDTHYTLTGELINPAIGVLDFHPVTEKPTTWKLSKHKRKTPKQYLEDRMRDLRSTELFKAGLTNDIAEAVDQYRERWNKSDWEVEEYREALIEKEYRKLLRRRSYHRVKARKAKVSP